jgi:hypothetical protein
VLVENPHQALAVLGVELARGHGGDHAGRRGDRVLGRFDRPEIDGDARAFGQDAVRPNAQRRWIAADRHSDDLLDECLAAVFKHLQRDQGRPVACAERAARIAGLKRPSARVAARLAVRIQGRSTLLTSL